MLEYCYVKGMNKLAKVDNYIDYFYNAEKKEWEPDVDGILMYLFKELDTSVIDITREEAERIMHVR